MITVATDPRGVVTFHHGQEPDGLLPVFRARSMRQSVTAWRFSST